MDSKRQLKFARELQRELSNILFREIDTQLGTVTGVTHVKISPDLLQAKVYLTVMPDEKRKEVLFLLNDTQVNIRHVLAQRIRHVVRAVPQLQFFYDDTLEQANKLDGILADLNAERATRPDPLPEELAAQYTDLEK